MDWSTLCVSDARESRDDQMRPSTWHPPLRALPVGTAQVVSPSPLPIVWSTKTSSTPCFKTFRVANAARFPSIRKHRDIVWKYRRLWDSNQALLLELKRLVERNPLVRLGAQVDVWGAPLARHRVNLSLLGEGGRQPITVPATAHEWPAPSPENPRGSAALQRDADRARRHKGKIFNDLGLTTPDLCGFLRCPQVATASIAYSGWMRAYVWYHFWEPRLRCVEDRKAR